MSSGKTGVVEWVDLRRCHESQTVLGACLVNVKPEFTWTGEESPQQFAIQVDVVFQRVRADEAEPVDPVTLSFELPKTRPCLFYSVEEPGQGIGEFDAFFDIRSAVEEPARGVKSPTGASYRISNFVCAARLNSEHHRYVSRTGRLADEAKSCESLHTGNCGPNM